MTNEALVKQIVEAGRLMLKLERMDADDVELQQTNCAFKAALAKLGPEIGMVALMVSRLLDHRSFAISSADPDTTRLYLDVASELGATVEHDGGGPLATMLAGALPPDLHSVKFNPPVMRREVTRTGQPPATPATGTK